MNQQIINYLKENKDKYSKEALIKELEKVGYNKKDTNEGIDIVFGGAAVVSNFWDFKSKKVYAKKSEKIKDFLFGFLGIIAINFCVDLLVFFLGAIVSIGGFVFYIFLLFYFFNRRRYIFYGLISIIFFGILAVAVLVSIFYFGFRSRGF